MKAMGLNDALADYYRVRRGRYSPNTWRAHEGQIERWRTWIIRETQPNVPLEIIADPDERYMERYFNRLRPPATEPRTFNNYRQYLNMFWRYCIAEGWVRTDPMRHVDALRVPKRVRLQLSDTELLTMLELAASPRDRVALALGMNTALRGGDVATLWVGSVNLTNDTLTAYVEKTDKETELAITADLRVELLRWFDEYATAMGLEHWSKLPNDWRLVPPAKRVAVNMRNLGLGTRLTYRPYGTLQHPERIVQRALTAMGLPTAKEGFHTLRRSAARAVFEEAKRREVRDPIRMAQTLLGHEHRSTTELYLGITLERQELHEMMKGGSFLHGDRAAPVADIEQGRERRYA